MDSRGRSCPLAYRYQPEALAQPAQLEADTLYVVGGLYGNPAALAGRARAGRAGARRPGHDRVQRRLPLAGRRPRGLPGDQRDGPGPPRHQGQRRGRARLRGRDAGCGCAYPDYVDDDVVDRSNQIITRLRATARRFPELVGRLGELPRLPHRQRGRATGRDRPRGSRVAGRLAAGPGGDGARRPGGPPPGRLAWPADHHRRAAGLVRPGRGRRLRQHPHRPALRPGRCRRRPADRLVVNNGSAGLPDFADTTYGVITRLSSDPRPPADSLYGTTSAALRCDALPVRFDLDAWTARFLAQWPPGSPGHRAYFGRITTRHPSAAGAGRTSRRRLDPPADLALLIDRYR